MKYTAHDRLMAGAWLGFLNWAIAEPGILAEFTAQTGFSFPAPPKGPLDLMIDRATRSTERTMVEFVKWATDNIWGERPKAYEEFLDNAGLPIKGGKP